MNTHQTYKLILFNIGLAIIGLMIVLTLRLHAPTQTVATVNLQGVLQNFIHSQTSLHLSDLELKQHVKILKQAYKTLPVNIMRC